MLKFILILIFSISSYAQIDIVFDIDGTLAYFLDHDPELRNETKIIKLSNGEKYILADGASEVIYDLSQRQDVRISFFSGGAKTRNEELLKRFSLPNGKSFYDIAYKIKSREDLISVSDDFTLRRSQRFKKDLTLINKDLSKIILVDDISYFLPAEQKNNVLWVGRSYKFTENFNPKIVGRRYPTRFSDWLREKNKVYRLYNKLVTALEKSNTNDSSFLNELKKVKGKRSSFQEIIGRLKAKYPSMPIRVKYWCQLPFI